LDSINIDNALKTGNKKIKYFLKEHYLTSKEGKGKREDFYPYKEKRLF
jgi:hypothetical protein